MNAPNNTTEPEGYVDEDGTFWPRLTKEQIATLRVLLFPPSAAMAKYDARIVRERDDYAAHIKAVVDAWPPFSITQKADLRRILGIDDDIRTAGTAKHQSSTQRPVLSRTEQRHNLSISLLTLKRLTLPELAELGQLRTRYAKNNDSNGPGIDVTALFEATRKLSPESEHRLRVLLGRLSPAHIHSVLRALITRSYSENRIDEAANFHHEVQAAQGITLLQKAIPHLTAEQYRHLHTRIAEISKDRSRRKA